MKKHSRPDHTGALKRVKKIAAGIKRIENEADEGSRIYFLSKGRAQRNRFILIEYSYHCCALSIELRKTRHGDIISASTK